jgi:hypothetical protein
VALPFNICVPCFDYCVRQVFGIKVGRLRYTIYELGSTLCVVTSFMPQKAMSNFDSNQFVTNFHAIHDQQIANSFNNPSNQPFLQV